MYAKDKIKNIKTDVIKVPLKKTWKISLYSAGVRYHIVVQIETENGIKGYGEVSPSPAFMGEEARIIKNVIDQFLAPQLIGSDPFDMELIHSQMDKAIQGNGAAKAAIDIALYDLQGKILDIPVYMLLGGKYRSEIPLTWVVSIQDINSALEEAERFIKIGIKTIKIKIGTDPKRDIALIEELRNRYGNTINIRVDANQGYRVDEAVRVLDKMESFDLDAIEQPVAAWDLEGMQYLANSLKTPIMADESVFSLEDAYKVIKMRAADIINIKIGKVGGIYPAKKIAAIAQAANIPITIGSNLELGIGSAASIHFGISTKNVLYPCDLMIGPDLHEFDFIDPSFSMEGGIVQPFDAPGLGVKVNIK
ncbi:MAG: hypothetical protein JRI44_01355 [Deltaproteobacteria bacterium]|nr:hypothetical protein [Deltaproteobacteria bacterium]